MNKELIFPLGSIGEFYVYRRLLKFIESFMLAIVLICLYGCFVVLGCRADNFVVLGWVSFILLLLLIDYRSLLSLDVTEIPLFLCLDISTFLSTERAESLRKLRT